MPGLAAHPEQPPDRSRPAEQCRDQRVRAVEDGGSPQQHATQASDRRRGDQVR